MNLLDFVALYGLVLMPMGAVVFLDVFLLPRMGLQTNFAEQVGLDFNWSAGLTWFITLLVCLLINIYWGIEIFFLGLPGWFIAAALYVGLSLIYQRKFNTQVIYQASD